MWAPRDYGKLDPLRTEWNRVLQLPEAVALVTGAARGIGRATAIRLATDGARVVVADIDEPAGRETVERIVTLGGEADFSGDVADEAEVARIVAAAEERFGGLDVLVNNAGGTPPPHFPEADSGTGSAPWP